MSTINAEQETKSVWKRFLTPEEKRMFKRIETAKTVWLKLNTCRAEILNRANQRARYHAAKQAMSPRERRRQRMSSEHTKGEG